jgi:predicted transcriptional regulator
MGVCVDMNIIYRESSIGLNKLSVLSKYSGGTVQYYKDSDVSSIPQDLFRRISSDSLCFNTVLRLRTSDNFKVKHSFDRLVGDSNVDNLYYIPSVDRYTCISFDFEFTSSSGFDR